MTLTDAAPAVDDSKLETVHLSNGLSCDIPSSSPLAKLLRSKRTWVGPSAKERGADPAEGEDRRDRRRLAEPGPLELLRRHLPPAVERLRAVLREPERHRDPRAEGLPRPGLASGGARHRRRVPPRQRHPVGHRRRRSRSAPRRSGCSSASGTRRPPTTASRRASPWSWTAASRWSTPASTAACTCSASTPVRSARRSSRASDSL